MRRALLALGVGLALADSSIVTLALPEILGEFDVAITTVAWVLTSFNLVLAVVVVPASYVARRRPREAFVAGSAVFAAASLGCGIAPSFDVLVGARCVQAVGAALVVTAALDLLAEVLDGDERALRTWIAASILGAALGPAIGGILTQLLGWESIFLAQVPLALALLFAVRGVGGTSRCVRRRGDRRSRRTPRCSSSPVVWSRRCSSSCCSSSTGGGCPRLRRASSSRSCRSWQSWSGACAPRASERYRASRAA